ncbi:hypothetical protein D3C84_1089620 [compost metagenome]
MGLLGSSLLIAARINRCSLRVSRYDAVISVLDFVTRSGLGSGLVGLGKLDITGPTISNETLQRVSPVVDTQDFFNLSTPVTTGPADHHLFTWLGVA